MQNNLPNFSGDLLNDDIPPPFTSGEEFLTDDYMLTNNNKHRGRNNSNNSNNSNNNVTYLPPRRRYSAEQLSRIFNENARRLRLQKLEQFKSRPKSHRVPLKGPQKLRLNTADPLRRVREIVANEAAYMPNVKTNLIRRRTVRPSPLSKNARKSNTTRKNKNRK